MKTHWSCLNHYQKKKVFLINKNLNERLCKQAYQDNPQAKKN